MPANNPRGNPATLTSYAPKWQSGQTQTVRIPVALVEQIMEHARKLDQGLLPDSNDSASQALSQVLEKLNRVAETPRNNFSSERRALLNAAIAELRALVTVNRL